MARRRKHEDHVNHEAWAIPYGDLITLLLAFFVVMYAISQVNEGKYRVLSDSLVAAFHGTPRTVDPIEVGEKQSGPGFETDQIRADHQPLAAQPRSLGMQMPGSSATSPVSSPRQITRRAAAAAQALRQVGDQLQDAMADLIKSDMVVVRRNEFWIEVEIKTDILFPSAGAQLAANAVGIMERLAKVLAPFNNLIRVEGHTDNRPISTVAFYSNWELSAARAASVVRVLASHGVAPARLAVIGYGDTRPRAPNTTAEGRDQNRRVVMVILSTDAKPDDQQQVPDSSPSASPNTAPATPPATNSATPPAANSAASSPGNAAAPPPANAAAPAAGGTPANGTLSAP
jgi:chemotaxis protein MotB